MRILITNDDGIAAPGIRMLAEWARTLGEVTVVAPKVEQSGMSHAIQFVEPIEIKKVPFKFEFQITITQNILQLKKYLFI